MQEAVVSSSKRPLESSPSEEPLQGVSSSPAPCVLCTTTQIMVSLFSSTTRIANLLAFVWHLLLVFSSSQQHLQQTDATESRSGSSSSSSSSSHHGRTNQTLPGGGRTFLLEAAKNGELKGVKHIPNMASESDSIESVIDEKDDQGFSPLMEAAGNGHLSIVELLLSKHPNTIHAVDKKGFTALSWASFKGRTEIVSYLLSKGAATIDVNHRAINGYNPLMLASEKGHYETVWTLIRAGADVNAKRDDAGGHALLFAAGQGFPDVCELLINNGADLLATTSKSRRTVLMAAAMGGKLETVEAILSEVVEQFSRQGKLEQHQEPTQPRQQRPQALLEFIDAADVLGQTALILTAARGHTRTVSYLLSQGADLSLSDVDGCSALAHACLGGHEDTIDVLINSTAAVFGGSETEAENVLRRVTTALALKGAGGSSGSRNNGNVCAKEALSDRVKRSFREYADHQATQRAAVLGGKRRYIVDDGTADGGGGKDEL